jgi:hypothetical protein
MTTLKPKTYTVRWLKKREAAVFKAHQAYQRAKGVLAPVVDQMRGQTLKHRVSGVLFRIGSGGDYWHLLSAVRADGSGERWNANPSEFEMPPKEPNV